MATLPKPKNADHLLELEHEVLTTTLDLLITMNEDLRGIEARHFMSRCDCHICQAFRLILEEIKLNESIQRIFRMEDKRTFVTEAAAGSSQAVTISQGEIT